MLATPQDAVPCPVDDNGRFTSQVAPYQGVHVKMADPQIIEEIAGLGRLVLNDRIVHSVPFCWRSDTPLIYKAVPSWFVSVETLKEKLLRNNEQTYWVPSFVKEK
jgi:isoleucyl-tRNA synthetase